MTSFDRSNSSITSLGRWGVPTASLFLLTRNIEGRTVGRHSWNDAMFSMFAPTHLEYELQYAKGFRTRGRYDDAAATTGAISEPSPPMAIWVLIPMSFLGDHEWTGRIAELSEDVEPIAHPAKEGGGQLGVRLVWLPTGFPNSTRHTDP